MIGVIMFYLVVLLYAFAAGIGFTLGQRFVNYLLSKY